MSKERARRREARQAEVAERAAKRTRQRAAQARRDAWKRRWLSWLPARPTGAPGLLAAKRRRTTGLLVFGFLAIQFLTWVATPDWGLRAAVALVSLFAFPLGAALSR